MQLAADDSLHLFADDSLHLFVDGSLHLFAVDSLHLFAVCGVAPGSQMAVRAADRSSMLRLCGHVAAALRLRVGPMGGWTAADCG